MDPVDTAVAGNLKHHVVRLACVWSYCARARHAGPAYTRQTIEQWYVTLGRGEMTTRTDGEIWMRVSYIAGGPLGQDGVFPGQSASLEDGRRTITQQSYGGMGLYEGQPGVSVTFDPPWSGGEPTLGSMPSSEWVKVVISLADVATTDTRLTTLWAQD